MTNDKKTMIISWVIGLGSGLFIAGIILSLLFYRFNKKELVENNKQVKEDVIVDSEKTNITNETNEDDTKPTDNIEIVEINIGPTATASEITQILLDNNIISDYQEFIQYIRDNDAEKKLIHGKKQFPLNADIKTIFEILTNYN